MDTQLSQTHAKSKKTDTMMILNFVMAVVLIALAILLYFLYVEYQDSQDEIDRLSNPETIETIQEDLINQTIEAVMEIAITPQEDPTVATILDADSLRAENPTFYEDAANGDKLLVYSTKAIIYRESTNKIVNIAPVFIQNIESTEDVDSVEVTDAEAL